MNDPLISALVAIAAISLYALAWMVGIVYVAGDTTRRGFGRWKRLVWLVLALVPMLGLTLYVIVYSRAAPAPAPPQRAVRQLPGEAVTPQPRRRITLPMRKATPGAAARPATAPVASVRRDTIATAPVSAVARSNATQTQPARPRYALRVIDGPHAGQEFVVPQLPLRIGRGPEAGIRLDADLSVSRRHAELYEQAGVLRVRDLGSSHGVSVNGYSIDDKSLAPGDQIRIGYSLLVVQGNGGPQ
jgi:hypothetical protein